MHICSGAQSFRKYLLALLMLAALLAAGCTVAPDDDADGPAPTTTGSTDTGDDVLIPYRYAGTTYGGYQEGSGTDPLPSTKDYYADWHTLHYGVELTLDERGFERDGVYYYGGITTPRMRKFSADGFFPVEAVIGPGTDIPYISVLVSKDGQGAGGDYYFRGASELHIRVWLPFGPGEYTVTITNGSFYGCGYGDWDELTVTNTRDEIGYYLYPTAKAWSDHPLVTSLVAEITKDAKTNTDKVKAVHDYLAMNITYDYPTYNYMQGTGPKPDVWRKWDALSVLGTRYHEDARYEPAGHYYAICDGYAKTTGTLLRAAGFPTKYVTGKVTSSVFVDHAWTQVNIDGTWKFIDTTWDSYGPTPDTVRYTYYLLDDFSTTNDDHYDWKIGDFW